jgi:hypothetical protein
VSDAAGSVDCVRPGWLGCSTALTAVRPGVLQARKQAGPNCSYVAVATVCESVCRAQVAWSGCVEGAGRLVSWYQGSLYFAGGKALLLVLSVNGGRRLITVAL